MQDDLPRLRESFSLIDAEMAKLSGQTDTLAETLNAQVQNGLDNALADLSAALEQKTDIAPYSHLSDPAAHPDLFDETRQDLEEVRQDLSLHLTDSEAHAGLFGEVKQDFFAHLSDPAAHPPGTTDSPGFLQLATDAEASAGTVTDKAVTPTGVKAAIAASVPTAVPTARNISTTAPLYGGGDLSVNRALYLSTIPVTLGGTGATTAAAAKANLGIVDGAPKPQTAAGVGQIVNATGTFSGGYVGSVAPTGGTWFAFLVAHLSNTSTGEFPLMYWLGASGYTGTVAGGTRTNVGGSGYNSSSLTGFYWRIA